MCWIRLKLHDLPRFDGTGLADAFIASMEDSVPETQRIQAMDVVVKGTPVHWWATHHTNLQDWVQVVECIKIRFQPPTDLELISKYKGTDDPH